MRYVANLTVVVCAALLSFGGQGRAVQPSDAELAARILKGALDVHAHIDPDSAGPHSNQAERSIDVVDLARLARDRGMRGFVAKMHYDTTAHVAYIVRKAVPGVEVYGLVGTNRAMGGVNPEAVAHMAEVKGGWGRIVNMPTWDAEFYVKRSKNPNRPFVSVSRGGELVPEVKQIIGMMATLRTRDSNGRLVLYTGHNAPEESLMMVREARRAGVPVLVSHPLIEFIRMPLALMEEAARLGAYLEIVTGFATGQESEQRIREHVEAIKKIGVAHFVLSSDRGQVKGPLHPDALVLAAKALISHGLTEHDVQQMLRDNPAKLLDLPPAPGTSLVEAPGLFKRLGAVEQ